MRVTQGGHDVPDEKLRLRFPRTVANLQLAVSRLPFVFAFDNRDLDFPFREAGMFEQGRLVRFQHPVPVWLQPLIRV